MATPSSAALLMVFLSSICVPCSHWCSTLGRSILPQLFEFQVIESILPEKAEWLTYDFSMIFCLLFSVCFYVRACATLGVLFSEFQFHGHYWLRLISGTNCGAFMLMSKLNKQTLHSMHTSDASSGSFVVSVGINYLCPGYCLPKFYESLPAYWLSTSYRNGLCWLVYLNAAFAVVFLASLDLLFCMRGCNIGLSEFLPFVDYVMYSWSDFYMNVTGYPRGECISHCILLCVFSSRGHFLDMVSPWKLLERNLLMMPMYCTWKNIFINSTQPWEESAPLIYIVITAGWRFSMFWVASMILEGFSFSKKLLVSILQEEPLFLWLIWNLQEATKTFIIMLLICPSNGKLNFIWISSLGPWLYLLWGYNLPLCVL